MYRGTKRIQDSVDARIGLPLYFENAILINEADGERKDADKAYVLFGAYEFEGKVELVRIVINSYDKQIDVNEKRMYCMRKYMQLRQKKE